MKRTKSFLEETRLLLTGMEFVIFFVILFICHFCLFYYLTNNFPFVLILSSVGTLSLFLIFIIPNRRLKRHQLHLSELLKYVTNVSFLLQAGENVLHALETSKNMVHEDIQKDIEKTIDKLRREAVLDTEHFKKYDFPALDQFHQNLLIKYERGGDASELFDDIQKHMLFELKKRDELYKRKKIFAFNVYILLGMVFGTLALLRYAAPFLWDIFLGFIAGYVVIALTYIAVLINLYFLEKNALDISVRL